MPPSCLLRSLQHSVSSHEQLGPLSVVRDRFSDAGLKPVFSGDVGSSVGGLWGLFEDCDLSWAARTHFKALLIRAQGSPQACTHTVNVYIYTGVKWRSQWQSQHNVQQCAIVSIWAHLQLKTNQTCIKHSKRCFSKTLSVIYLQWQSGIVCAVFLCGSFNLWWLCM